MDAAVNRLDAADRQEARRKLDELARQEEHAHQRLLDDLASVGRWKKRPVHSPLRVVLALGLSIALTRFMAVNSTVCAVLWGEGLRGSGSDKRACVFYAE